MERQYGNILDKIRALYENPFDQSDNSRDDFSESDSN